MAKEITMVKIKTGTRNFVKSIAAKQNKTLQDLLEEILQEFILKAGKKVKKAF